MGIVQREESVPMKAKTKHRVYWVSCFSAFAIVAALYFFEPNLSGAQGRMIQVYLMFLALAAMFVCFWTYKWR